MCGTRVLPVGIPIVVLCALLASCDLLPTRALPDGQAESVAEGFIAQDSLRRERDDWSGESPQSDSAARIVSRAEPALASAGAAVASTSTAAPATLSVDAIDAPLQGLLVALARDAGLTLALQSAPAARVSISAHEQSLAEILDTMAMQVPFHWTRRGRQLTVRGDVLFTDSHPVDYLNMDRSTRGSVGLATRVGSIDASGGLDQSGAAGNGIANNSETLIENTAEHRVWESLARDVVEILGVSAAQDPDDAERGRGAGRGATSVRWSINRDAGLITLHARPATHLRLSRYLDSLHATAQRQVLIEASVVEVALSDSFEAGIDWQVLAKGVTGLSAAQVLGGQSAVNRDSVGRLAAPTGLVSLVQTSGDADLRATLSLLERFGDVRILSRPRIIALNNQSSVLKVVDNRVYFTTRVERRSSDERDDIVTDTEIHTVPVGLVMNVTPFIGAAGAVMLNVRPTLSRILGFVDDPNPELALANVRNGVPEIQVREMESMLRVQSGDVAIIGGLMQESLNDDKRSLPGLARVPWFGKLFKRRSQSRVRTELLIVLKPTVMPSAPRLASRDIESAR